MGRWADAGWPALAGLLLAASLPPWGWWPLAFAGAAILYDRLEGEPWRRRLLIGWIAGLGLYLPGLWWMQEFSLPGFVIAVVLEALFVGAVAVVTPSRAGWSRALAFPAAMVVVEAFRGRWPFGGLPLAGVDLGQVGGPLAPAARLAGHLVLVGLLAGAGVVLAAVARRRIAVAAVGLAAVVVIALAGAATRPGRVVGHLRVAAVQGGGVRGLRAVHNDQGVVYEKQLAATQRVAPPVDLVVWPEDVIHVPSLDGSQEDADLTALADRLGAPIVAGVVEDAGPGHFRNAAVVWAPGRGRVARYDKVHRVPFGEYIPLRSIIEHLADLSLVPDDAVAGHGSGVLAAPPPVGRIGAVISYEVFFADRARSAIAAGGALLLVPTNAGSFATGQVPAQELGAARLRAIETGRDVVQAAPTGYTAAIDARGRVRARTGLGAGAVLRATVARRTGKTPYVRTGDGPLVLVGVGFVGLGWFRARGAA
ncbi:MAG: putative Apolipoprotein N-acyltransferase [Acidimicrobiales bacterium]|jgi:apolipoprotein N-acyltransferase|nr:putative Apolipoprotein N-acyltransferase [Acidimicrobiales bacterium]